MTHDPSQLFVVSGGPGAGKTTLIDALERAGYARTIEAGRGVIQDQVAIGGRALPWIDPQAFAELMLCWEMRSYRIASALTGPVLCDRGVLDVVGYLRLMGLKVPDHMERAARQLRYDRRVFIAEPWPAIFTQDAERKQTLAEAEESYRAAISTYRDYDYELVMLPRASVAERVRFVRAIVG
jgi:predicted ATPase